MVAGDSAEVARLVADARTARPLPMQGHGGWIGFTNPELSDVDGRSDARRDDASWRV